MFKEIRNWLITNFCYSSELTLIKQDLEQKTISLDLLKESYDNLTEEYVRYILNTEIRYMTARLNKKVYDKIIDIWGKLFYFSAIPIDNYFVNGREKFKWNKMTPADWLVLYRYNIYPPAKYITFNQKEVK
mgnify:CR=1 FL=1